MRSTAAVTCVSLLLALQASAPPLSASAQAQDLEAQEPGEQEPVVEVVLTGAQRARLRLAFPEPAGLADLSGGAAEAARELDQTLRRDLEWSGIFDLQGPAELAILTLTGEQSADFEQYRSLGNELLLATTLKPEGDRLILEGRIHQLQDGRSVLGKRYRGTLRVARRIAHTFADEIVQFFTGRKGISLTSIAFYSDREGADRREIYVMDYDGWNQRPITAHQTLSLSPEWSPGGDTIAYVSYLSGEPGIYLADLRSGRKSPVLTEGSLNMSPAFSPDGRKIAFARTTGDNTEIFVCNRDGSDLRRLTTSSGIDTNPAWSPTGRELAFTSSRGGSPQIYVMGSEGTDLRRISFEGDYNDGAAWSPDGTRIAHATRRDGRRFHIAVTDLVTLESRILTTMSGSHEAPTFSPDGRKIAFASERPGAGTQILVIDTDGGNPKQLTSEGNNRAPSWSGFLK